MHSEEVKSNVGQEGELFGSQTDVPGRKSHSLRGYLEGPMSNVCTILFNSIPFHPESENRLHIQLHQHTQVVHNPPTKELNIYSCLADEWIYKHN